MSGPGALPREAIEVVLERAPSVRRYVQTTRTTATMTIQAIRSMPTCIVPPPEMGRRSKSLTTRRLSQRTDSWRAVGRVEPRCGGIDRRMS
jgi:hypothetical protein